MSSGRRNHCTEAILGATAARGDFGLTHLQQITDDIRHHYGDDKDSEAIWAKEADDVKNIVEQMIERLAGSYDLSDCLGVGGSGIVLRAHDNLLDVDRALKVPRPSPGLMQRLAEVLTSETDRLIELSHPYIMRVHARGWVKTGEFDYPYYVMDLFESIDDADDYVANEEIQQSDILQLIERILEAVVYMHDQGQIHLDIKPGNILVKPGNQPVIGDLGFAKRLSADDKSTWIGGTKRYMHPEPLSSTAEGVTDSNRLRGKAPRSVLRRQWDLYSLGCTILELLNVIEHRTDRPMDLYTHRYVKLLAYRLLDGQNTVHQTMLGLSPHAFAEIKYDSSLDALVDIKKLTGGTNLESRVPELDQFGSEAIQASTLATTRFTPRVKALLDNGEVARLGGFTQLSLLNLVYPTATHTRLEHVIGVYSAMCRYVSALYHDPINPLFRQIMTEQDIVAALVVSLVHDVGHYALAHDLEEAEGDIFSHEARGLALLENPQTGLRDIIECAVLPDGAIGWNVPIERVLSILKANVAEMNGTIKDRLIHALIDGPIDADKVDYLIRDSSNLGLTYGAVIDVERLLRVLTVVTRPV